LFQRVGQALLLCDGDGCVPLASVCGMPKGRDGYLRLSLNFLVGKVLFEYLLEKATTVKEVFDLTLMRMEYLEGRVVELEQQVKQLKMELIRK
jgi:hypothetical protein